MRRMALGLLAFLCAQTAHAQVQSLGGVTFAVPDGWTYKPGAEFGSVMLISGQSLWLMAAYTPMPSSGDASSDLKAAWARIVRPGKDYEGFPALPYYPVNHTVGYPAVRADASSANRTTYTRLHVREAGKSFIPVTVARRKGRMLNSMEQVANWFIGSMRLAPLKA
jgi:hypothetical protein